MVKNRDVVAGGVELWCIRRAVRAVYMWVPGSTYPSFGHVQSPLRILMMRADDVELKMHFAESVFLKKKVQGVCQKKRYCCNVTSRLLTRLLTASSRLRNLFLPFGLHQRALIFAQERQKILYYLRRFRAPSPVHALNNRSPPFAVTVWRNAMARTQIRLLLTVALAAHLFLQCSPPVATGTI